MKPCPNRKETLMLDVFEELQPNERAALEVHLEQCAGCRQEREKLIHFLEEMKGALTVPELSASHSKTLALCVKRKLADEMEKGWRGKWIFSKPKRLILALSVACLLIVAVSWLSIREMIFSASSITISNAQPEERMIVKDLDIIENLELLEDMETIEKLAQQVEATDVM